MHQEYFIHLLTLDASESFTQGISVLIGNSVSFHCNIESFLNLVLLGIDSHVNVGRLVDLWFAGRPQRRRWLSCERCVARDTQGLRDLPQATNSEYGTLKPPILRLTQM